MLAAALAGIVGLAAFAIHSNREAAPAVSPPAAERAAQPPRPALTAAEEQYIRELWPIHGDVQRSAMRMSLGQIFYLTKDLGRDELGTRVKEALATYQAACQSGHQVPESIVQFAAAELLEYVLDVENAIGHCLKF